MYRYDEFMGPGDELGEPTDERPTVHPGCDIEFMGRMLGVRDLEGQRHPWGTRRASYNHRVAYIDAVKRAMADPVANARARQRIGELLTQCEHILTGYARIGDDCFHCGRPFRWPAGVTCQGQERHAPPFTLEESARIRAEHFGGHSPRHFARDN